MNSGLHRYLFFLTELRQRRPKCIYYYKNVNAIGIHYPYDMNAGSWKLEPSGLDGHFLPHFREEPERLFNGKFNGSILKLNIDFEYLFFILKTFTSYCNKSFN